MNGRPAFPWFCVTLHPPFLVEDFVELLNLATDFDFTEVEYLTVGERIWNLTRMFNVREGIRRRDDTLPARLMEEPLPEGGAKGQVVTREALDRMLDEYYRFRGWDQESFPTEEKLAELNLSDVAEQLRGLRAMG